MAKVLVTGIAGFIGSSLAHRLLAEGATVSGIDDLSTGKLENLNGISHRIALRQANILDDGAMEEACRGIDYVFHQAAIPSVQLSVDDPLGTHECNLSATLRVLQSARNAGVRRVIYAASASAYGDNPALPKREDMLPEPISPYAVQKLTGELYAATYARVFGLETVALRYFNIFGPRQDPASQYSGVLARFIAQMTQGETPTIFGDGSTSRDFTYVDNVVAANLAAATAPSAVSGRVFNIATGERTTLLEACAAIREITGYRGPVNFQPERPADIRHSVADISLARKFLGYRVVSRFREGLEHTVEAHRIASAEHLSVA